MNSSPTYKIKITDYFKKQLKRLVKKNQAIPIGAGVYKMRLKGQNKGKSGGYRLYILIIETDGILVPIYIYAKNEKENLRYEELSLHLENTKSELIKLL